MDQVAKAEAFTRLHRPGKPLVLFNIWDPGSAAAVTKAGAPALATGSASVAMANGFPDGEQLPLASLVQVAQRICESTEMPVSIDFEGGYATDPDELAVNLESIINAGAIGINFEDQIVNGEGRYPIEQQCQRIAALRKASDALGVPLFINARTDVFLQARPGPLSDSLWQEVLTRVSAYQDAGASGLFAPGLTDQRKIESLCQHTHLPINIMMMEGAPTITQLAELGVARISFGPGPYLNLMAELTSRAAAVG